MNNIRGDNSGIKITIFHSLFTLLYTPILYLVLQYSNNFYNVGKYKSWYILVTFVLAEILKGIYTWIKNDNVLREPKNKLNKYSTTKLKEILKTILLFGVVTAIVFLSAILFGAPILDSHEQTLMFSLLVSILSILPSCINLGVDATIGLLVYHGNRSADRITDMMRLNICLTIFGAWLAAIVVPLDWDRPWQQWPIPSFYGALAGNGLASAITLLKFVPQLTKRFFKRNRKYK